MSTETPSSLMRAIFSRRMLVALVMGFACGLPLLLTISVLQAWMKEAGVDLSHVRIAGGASRDGFACG